MNASDRTTANELAELELNSWKNQDMTALEIDLAEKARLKEALEQAPETCDYVANQLPVIDGVNELIIAIGGSNHIYDPKVIKALESLFPAVRDALQEYVRE